MAVGNKSLSPVAEIGVGFAEGEGVGVGEELGEEAGWGVGEKMGDGLAWVGLAAIIGAGGGCNNNQVVSPLAAITNSSPPNRTMSTIRFSLSSFGIFSLQM